MVTLPVDAETGVKSVKAKLPSGLKLAKVTDTKWLISGSPKKMGTYTATFTVNTQQKKSLTKTISWKIEAEPLEVNYDQLSGATLQVGQMAPVMLVSATSASGIKSIKASKLPSGMKVQKMNGQWVITGTPKKAGTYHVTLTITTKAGSKWTQVIPVVVAFYPTWMAGRYDGPITYNWYDKENLVWDNMLGYVITEIDAAGNVIGAAALAEFGAYGMVDTKAKIVEQTANKITLHVVVDWYDETDKYLMSYPTDLIIENRSGVVTLTYQSTFASTDYMTGVLSKSTK